VVAVLWARRSGRAYVNHMLGPLGPSWPHACGNWRNHDVLPSRRKVADDVRLALEKAREK